MVEIVADAAILVVGAVTFVGVAHVAGGQIWQTQSPSDVQVPTAGTDSGVDPDSEAVVVAAVDFLQELRTNYNGVTDLDMGKLELAEIGNVPDFHDQIGF